MTFKSRTARLATMLAALLVSTLLIMLGVAIWFGRDQAMLEWRAQLDNLSMVLAEQTAQEVKSAFLVLDSLAEGVRAAGVQDAAGMRARMGTAEHFASMRDKIQGLPQLDVATIVAANGDVINFTRGYPVPALNLADRDYFREHLKHPHLRVFVSAPVRNRSNGQWNFYLSRRLDGPHGEFLGLAIVGFSSNFLSNFYSKINLGDAATVTLYRRDFTLLARWPRQDAMMGKVNASGSSYRIIQTLGLSHGVVEVESPRLSQGGDTVRRLGAARLVEGYPLIINVTVTDKLFLAQWRRFSMVLLLVGGLSALVIGVVFSVLVRLLRSRERAIRDTRRLRAVAETANRSKSEFLAMMSHEIRTPLTAIIGFAETLGKPVPGLSAGPCAGTDAAAAAAGQVILRNGHHLLTIINDILDISKIEAGRLHLEQLHFSPLELAGSVHAMMSAQAAGKGLAFELAVAYPIPAMVQGDPTRWKQILFNLAGNAIKFTERGRIAIALRYDVAHGRLVVEVADTGIGISEQQMAGLFKPFAQADSSVARRYGGTGLGLHLIGQLAERMGGGVRLRSVVGQGTTFEVDIVAPPAPGAPWLDSAPAPHPAPLAEIADPLARRLSGRVLLAEDGLDNQALIGAWLRQLGLEHTTVSDGAQAVQAALAGQFDLVLMDIQMPVMDGVRATETLRAAGYGRPIVALTANVMPEDLQRYADAGCTATVGKPVNVALLVQALAQNLPEDRLAADVVDLAQVTGYAEIAARFRATLAGRVEALALAVGQGRWTDAAALAHGLKGTAGAFGFTGVTFHAGRIEVAARTDDKDGARGAVEQLLALEELATLSVAGGKYGQHRANTGVIHGE